MPVSRALLVCLMLAGHGTTLAAAPEAPLRDALATVPAAALAGAPVRFVDLAVVSELAGGPPGASHLKRIVVGQDMAPLASLAMAKGDEWQAATGIPPQALVFATAFGTPPNAVSVWGLRHADDAAAVIAHLPDQDFSRSRGVFSNGKDQAMNPAARAPGNPWRGLMGRTAVVGAKDRVLVQGFASADVRAVLNARATADDGPADLAAQALAAAGGNVVQAVVFGPTFGLDGGTHPAALLGKSPAQARQAIDAAMATAGTGVPPYGAGVLADLQRTEGPALAIALAYDDCTLAQAAAPAMAALWQAGPPATARKADANAPAPLPGTAEVHTVDGGCAAVLTVAAGQSEPTAINPAFGLAMQQFHRRQLSAIRIGQAP